MRYNKGSRGEKHCINLQKSPPTTGAHAPPPQPITAFYYNTKSLLGKNGAKNQFMGGKECYEGCLFMIGQEYINPSHNANSFNISKHVVLMDIKVVYIW